MRYIFDGYTLDTRRYELYRDGKFIPLRPKVYEMLYYLLAHHDRVVAKGELLEHLWPEQFIGDATLNSCLMAVRKAVGDNGQAQRFIKTLRGRGYRFMATVEVLTDEWFEQASRSASPPTQAEPANQPIFAPALSDISTETDISGFDAYVPEGEHKSVTVLSCALVDALPLASRVGPETMHRLMQMFFAQAREIVNQYEGTLTEFVGDGYTALFGAPIALEDHARRATLAALEIRQRLSENEAIQSLVPKGVLAVHIGLHAGPAVVGRLAHDTPQIYTAVGDTTDQATRLLHLAPPDTILISASTYRLVEEEVQVAVYEHLANEVSSVSSLVYAVRGLVPRRAGVSGRGLRPLGTFVGRDRELAMLHERLTHVESGQGQMVGIAGEPGIGKSRLLYEFSRRLDPLATTYCEGHSLPFGSTTPYVPLRGVCRQACGLLGTDSREAMMAKIRRCLTEAGMSAEDDVFLLMQLLGDAAVDEPLSHLSPQARRMRIFEVLRQLMMQISRRQPLVMTIENLHWIDATSEEWLATFVEHMTATPILLLATYRPGYQPPWLGQSIATQIALPRLLPDDSCLVVRSAQNTVHLSEPMVQAIVTKAAGNPFFLEELTWRILESDTLSEPFPIPDSVQAVLMARIDQLSAPEKWLLQTAAVLGTSVLFCLLSHLTSLDEVTLSRRLRVLQTAEFLYETQTVPERLYTFRHALTRDVAYQSLLTETRQKLHEQIAHILTEHFPEIARTQPELVAHHYTEAGCVELAVIGWQQAGQLALNHFAHVEAHRHVTRGIDLLSAYPDPSTRIQHELNLHLMLGRALTVLKGYTDPEVERAYARTAELSQQMGDAPQFFTALHGLWAFYFVGGRHRTARELGERYLDLAQSTNDPANLLESHCSLGESLLYLGEFSAAREHFEQSIRHYDPQHHSPPHSHRFMIHDPGVLSRAFEAHTAWMLGYPDEAVAIGNAALAIAQGLCHPFSLILASWAAALVHQFRREALRVQERAETAVRLAGEQGSPYWLGQGLFLHGWALAAQELHSEGVEQMHRGWRICQQTGAKSGGPYRLALLAEVHHDMGNVQKSLALLDEALHEAQHTSEFYFGAEIYRLKGECLQTAAHEGSHGEWTPEVCFQTALDMARRQQTKSLELRAAMSLSRLWRQQGEEASAIDLLASVYDWFTEGLDTADLRAAKALLQALEA